MRPTQIEFREYQAKKILNVHKRVDGGWFWSKYSAHPYVGCRSGCEFCYLRGYRYLGRRDPNTFDTVIQVKMNAVELLRKELSRQKPDVIVCGDWQQPAEDRYRLSRQMLEVVLELGFPLVVIERSPLVLRDLDLLQEINRKIWVGVLFSMSNVDPGLKQAFEPRSPGIKRRLQAMKQIAQAGIVVGASLMPIIPVYGDDESTINDAIRAIKDHGGTFALGSGLTMDGVQAERVLGSARRLDPSKEGQLRALYGWDKEGEPNYGPSGEYGIRLSGLVRELCARHGIRDRVPRYIPPGPLASNKRVAELLFLKVHELELEQALDRRIWAYRKAAWTVDEWPESIAALYQEKGETGLQELPGIGSRLAGLIGQWLREESAAAS
jgi:DNA repair photolyase